jgi:hypothetical protein
MSLKLGELKSSLISLKVRSRTKLKELLVKGLEQAI